MSRRQTRYAPVADLVDIDPELDRIEKMLSRRGWRLTRPIGVTILKKRDRATVRLVWRKRHDGISATYQVSMRLPVEGEVVRRLIASAMGGDDTQSQTEEA